MFTTTVNATVYNLTAEEIGSSAVTRNYGTEFSFREVTSNGERGDRMVTLYEANDGSFFATTNGDPIWESEFDNMGLGSLSLAAAAVESGFEGTV